MPRRARQEHLVPLLTAATPRRTFLKRRAIVAGVLIATIGGAFIVFSGGDPEPLKPWQVRGSTAWAGKHWGNANAPNFRDRHIVEMDFLGEIMYVHEDVQPHFLRLAQIFRELAPEYAAEIDISQDDWSYFNRDIRGGTSKSNHAWGIAIDINALTNVLGTEGDMPEAVVRRWEEEGGEWGGDWSRPDPMHFETHLTPEEIRERYLPDGSPR